LRAESYGAELRWDRWDYAAVGVSALLAVLTDVLLVGTPATSRLTRWLKRYDTNKSDDWFARWAQTLANECKVPYDKMRRPDNSWIDGMSGDSHRFQTLGHDPVLGFVFGILDIMRGTVTGFSYEKLANGGGFHRWMQVPALDSYEPVGLIEAFLRYLRHLLSDVATSRGLPAPFMPLLQAINAGHFGKKDRTVGEVARYMYLKGYDLRHFLVAGLTPGVIETVLRGYVMLRQYRERGEISLGIASSPKYRAMLLSAHGIAALANAGKVTLSAGVLGINVAEWQALVRYLVPSLKYWVLDRHRIEMEHLERINEAGWEELVQNGNARPTRVLRAEADVVVLSRGTA
jgi:hypothetical protein